MSDPSISDIIQLINERDKHTQDKLVEVSDTLKEVITHMVVSKEDKKHDAEFKKEIRSHVKFAEPILYKARDHQEVRGKIVIAALGCLVAAAIGAFVKFG